MYKFNLKHFAANFDNKWTLLNATSVSTYDDINWFEKKLNNPSRIIVTYFLACDNPAYLTAKWLLTTPHSHLFRILKSLFFVRILLSKHCWNTLSFNYLLNTNTISFTTYAANNPKYRKSIVAKILPKALPASKFRSISRAKNKNYILHCTVDNNPNLADKQEQLEDEKNCVQNISDLFYSRSSFLCCYSWIWVWWEF